MRSVLVVRLEEQLKFAAELLTPQWDQQRRSAKLLHRKNRSLDHHDAPLFADCPNRGRMPLQLPPTVGREDLSKPQRTLPTPHTLRQRRARHPTEVLHRLPLVPFQEPVKMPQLQVPILTWDYGKNLALS